MLASRPGNPPASRERARPLVWHLSVFAAALLLPTLVVVLLFAQFAARERDRLQTDVRDTAREIRVSVDRELATLRATLETLAGASSLRAGDIDGFADEARRAASILDVNIVVRDLEGHQLLNTRIPRGEPLPQDSDLRDVHRSALATGHAAVSNLIVATNQERPVVTISLPIMSRGEPVYLLGLNFPTTRLRDRLAEAGLDGPWRIGVIDGAGVMVARYPNHESYVGRAANPDFLARSGGESGAWRGINLQGVDTIAGYARSSVADWHVVVGVPASMIEAPFRQSVGLLVLIVATSIALALTLAWFFGRRIATPMSALADAAGALGRGEEVGVLATSVAEVNEVANAFAEAAEMVVRARDLQAQLIHVGRLTEMGQMASALAHEINQPLTAIANYLQAGRRLVERDAAPDQLREVMTKATAQSQRAGEIIRRLRNFLTNTEGDRRVEALGPLVEDAVALGLLGMKQQQSVETALDIDPSLPPVLVDRIQIQQVLVNLVRNAAEAMAESTRPALVVAARPVDDLIELSVADTGTGLAPDVAGRLFQPFNTTKATGMGVGLSICRAIIEAHGGRIWAENRETGGTVFRFTVPVAQLAAALEDVPG